MKLTKDGCTVDFPPHQIESLKRMGWKDPEPENTAEPVTEDQD